MDIKKRLFAVLPLMFMLCFCFCTAHAEDVTVDGGIGFVSANGAAIRAFPDTSSEAFTMYAEARIKNSGASDADMMLIVAAYDGSGNLSGVTYSTVRIGAGSEETARTAVTIPKGAAESDYTCKAYLWDSLTGSAAPRAESVFLDFDTGLNGITIGGALLDDYSDEVDSYSVQISEKNADIAVFPRSGGASVNYAEINVPGTSRIRISAGSKKREITVNTFLSESEKYSLTSLSYKIGDEIYPIEDFDPGIYSYSVNLPDNTFYVTLLPEAQGEISCKVQDINDSPNSVDGVSFGVMRSDTTGPAYAYKRDAVNDIIPIKNENTRAYITVTDGASSTEYVIMFRSVQPRLTSFNLTGAGGTYVPVFTSGAGFNNDNGTICAADRVWAAANISKKLIGASYFMSPYNNKSGQWWNESERSAGDEYFNFTADTSGTVYFMGKTSPSSYSDWKKVNDGVTPKHPTSYKLGDKTWNDYSDTDYYAECIQWNSNIGRCDVCGVNETTDALAASYLDGAFGYSHVFTKHFEAGETVSITHTGLFGDAAAQIIWAIVWDVDVNYPGEASGGEDEVEEGLVLELDASDNIGDGYLDDFTDIWVDLSGNGNDVMLTPACEWSSESLIINTGTKNASDAVKLSGTAAEVINSYNFTLEFALENIDSSAAVAASENEEFSICEEKGKLSFYFAGIYKNPISVNADDALSGMNRITVSTSGNNVSFKWYVNGELKSEKTVTAQALKTVDTMMLGSYNKVYSGIVSLNCFRLFDRVKGIEE